MASIVGVSLNGDMRRQMGRAKTEEEKAVSLKATLAALEILEAAFKVYSKGKPFFGGDSVGYLDTLFRKVLSRPRLSVRQWPSASFKEVGAS
ncbi:hypothetical protein EJB05_23640, partial [Eragrostis curvula]